MSENNLSVTVSINTFNRPDALFECLDSLSKQTFRDFDIIVVNGGNSKSVEDVSRKFNLPIRIVNQKRKGLVEARNLCWKETQSDIVCIIDDDLIVSQGWLKEIVGTFSSSKDIGGVTGPTLINEHLLESRDATSFVNKFSKGNFIWKLIGKFYLDFLLEGKVNEIGKIVTCGTFTLGSNYKDCLNLKNTIEVDYLEACCMCFRRRLIDKAGEFDYIYTGTSEWSEPDLSFKVKKLGYRLVFNPKAVAEHKVSQQGVFKARTYAFERSVNFINFYFKNIKPNNLKKIIKFYSYLVFMNAYWIYKAFESGNLNWLSGLTGTCVGILRNIVNG